jgi:hypothetical protein
MAEQGNAFYDVGKFSSRIAANGLASPNKFEVIFKRIPHAGQNDLTQLSLMCDQVSLAGRDVQAVLDLQYGIRRQVAYNAPAYTPLSVSFLCTDQMLEKTILDKWNNLIVPVQRGFHVAYYDDYIGEMDVYVLDRSGKKKTYHMHYHEVYPKTVTAVELNHGTTNATLRVTAEIQYAYWTTNSFGHRTGATEVGGQEATAAINFPSTS